MAASKPFPFVVGGQTRVVSDSTASNAIFINADSGHITLSGSIYMSAAETNNNTFYGFTALDSITFADAVSNTAFGDSALTTLVDGDNNTALGFQSLTLATGQQNTAAGSGAGDTVGAGDDNTLIGYKAGDAISTGSDNIALGSLAGNAVSTTDSNIFIGNTGSAGDSNRAFIGTRTTHDIIDMPDVRARLAPVNIAFNAGTLTVANLQSAIMWREMGASGEWELPDFSDFTSAFTGLQDNDALDFYVLNTAVGGAFDITLAPSDDTNITILGQTVIASVGITNTLETGSAHFRLVFSDVAGTTAVCYRLG